MNKVKSGRISAVQSWTQKCPKMDIFTICFFEVCMKTLNFRELLLLVWFWDLLGVNLIT
jgi:hypothetical protein